MNFSKSFLRFVCLLGVCIAFSTFGFSQIPGSQVTVEKLFDARLADAKRIETKPSLPSIDTNIVAQQYEVIPVKSNIDYKPPKIRPLRLKRSGKSKTYPGFVRLGVGMPLSWLGDVVYSTSNDNIAIRGDLSTYGFTPTSNKLQKYSRYKGTIGGTYYTKSGIAVDLDLGYKRRNYGFYGFEAITGLNADSFPTDLTQNFGTLGISAGIRNSKPTALNIDYFAKINTQFLADHFGSKERNIDIAFGSRKDFGEHWYGEVDLNIDLTRFKEDITQTMNVYKIKPGFGYHQTKFALHLGIDVSSLDDEFYLFPNAKIGYNIGNGFVIVAGAEGQIYKNNYTALTNYLPYLTSKPTLQAARKYNYFAGVQGQIKSIQFEAKANYGNITNLALFSADTIDVYKFMPRYDTATVVGLDLEISVPIDNKLSGSLNLNTRVFNLKNYEKPYLLPSFDAQIVARYQVIPERMDVKGLVTLQNALPVLNADTTMANNTNFLADLSIHGDYKISQNFGAFVQLNNLFNNKRNKFPNYPILGTNVILGITTKF